MQSVVKKKRLKDIKSPKGMGLVEVVVAIGISVVTLTTAVVFSTQLSRRAEENFVESSVLQLQSLISEELRLVEQGLKKDVIAVPARKLADGQFLPASGASLPTPQLTWAQFCSNKPLDKTMAINLPDFSSSVHKVSLYPVNSGTTLTVPSDGSQYIFSPVIGNPKFGSFTNINVDVSLTKIVSSTNIGTGADVNTITIKSIIHYKMFGRDYFTKPQEIKMIYNSVCVSS